jgi:hypothetical protein
MIPDSESLQKMNRGLNVPDKPYFDLAYEYLDLRKLFMPDDLMDFLVLLFDLILYPVWILFSGQPSAMDILPLMKCLDLWKDLFRFQELSADVWYWKFLIRLVGGPWISTNAPEYHTLVYADAMTRLTGVSQRID